MKIDLVNVDLKTLKKWYDEIGEEIDNKESINTIVENAKRELDISLDGCGGCLGEKDDRVCSALIKKHSSCEQNNTMYIFV